MTDFMESQRDWEKVQLAKLAHMLAYWQKQPVEATKEIPENIGAAGRNIGAYTAGIVGDVASIVPGANMAAGGQAPTSEDLLEEFGRKEHWSNLFASFVAPGPGEIKGALKAMLGLGKDMSGMVELAQSLFHGTRHKFDKFDLSAIGTGEGAQAYGHGLYFAESPGVAKSYQSQLSDFDIYVGGKKVDLSAATDEAAILDTLKAQAGRTQLRNGNEIPPEVIDDLRNYFVDAGQMDDVKALDRMVGEGLSVKQAGHLYEVDIPDETIGKMLDWDAPLSEQPESVRDAIQRIGLSDPPSTRWAAKWEDVSDNMAVYRAKGFEGGAPHGVDARDVVVHEIERGNIPFRHLTDEQIDTLAGASPDELMWVSRKKSTLFDEFGPQYDPSGNKVWDGLIGSEDEIHKISAEGTRVIYDDGDYVLLFNDNRARLGDPKGREIYETLGIRSHTSPEETSRILNEAGIPGIRFLDGQSRPLGANVRPLGAAAQKQVDELRDRLKDFVGDEYATKKIKEKIKWLERQPTRNIVVFNPDDITRVKRDGELVYKSGSKLEETIDLIDKY